MSQHFSDASVANLIRRIEESYLQLRAFIDTSDETQMTERVDHAGWTVKDHIMHLAVWADGLIAIMDGGPRWTAMGVSEATWDEGMDPTNAAIQQQHKDKPLDEVLAAFEASHQRVLDRINTLEDDDLMKLYDGGKGREAPLLAWVMGNCAGHYSDHLPWMHAIVEDA